MSSSLWGKGGMNCSFCGTGKSCVLQVLCEEQGMQATLHCPCQEDVGIQESVVANLGHFVVFLLGLTGLQLSASCNEQTPCTSRKHS